MPNKLHPSRTYSFASIADCNVTDGVMLATATVAATAQLTVGDFAGSVVLTGGALRPPRMLTITRSLATGAYTTDPIVLTGRYGGVAAVANMTQNADGGDTVRSGILFDGLTTVDLPAMGSTGGSYTIGVEDIGASHGDTLMGAKMAVAGPSALVVAYDNAGAETDTIEADATIQPGGFRRIATANMSQGFTAYFP